MNVVVGLVAVVCFLFVVGIDFFTLAVPYTTAILSLSFIFGESLKNTFNSFVFIFFGTNS